jgi:hypothetical protein
VTRPREAVDLGLEQAAGFRERYSEVAFATALRDAINLTAFKLGERPYDTQRYVDFQMQI